MYNQTTQCAEVSKYLCSECSTFSSKVQYLVEY